MSTLLIVIGVLFLMVMGRSILDPWPSIDPVPGDEGRVRTMQSVTDTVF
jgi:hypothetical protein